MSIVFFSYSGARVWPKFLATMSSGTAMVDSALDPPSESRRVDFSFPHLNFPVRTKEFPVRFHREFSTNHPEPRLFFRGEMVGDPSDLQNSRFFSVIDGNLIAETGSIWTASSASD